MFTLQSGRKIRPAPATTLGKAVHKQGKGGGRPSPEEEEMASAGGLKGSRPSRAGSSRNNLTSKICPLEKKEFREKNKIRKWFILYTD